MSEQPTLYRVAGESVECGFRLEEHGLVPVEPVGFLELYSPRESVDGASVESIRWFGPKKLGRYAIVRLDDE